MAGESAEGARKLKGTDLTAKAARREGGGRCRRFQSLQKLEKALASHPMPCDCHFMNIERNRLHISVRSIKASSPSQLPGLLCSGYWRRLAVLAVSANCLALVGCSDIHLYRQSSLDLANKALTAFSDAKLTDSISGERNISDAITQQEQALARRNTLARRDAELIEIFGQANAATSWGLLTNKLASRIQEIMSPEGLVQYSQEVKSLNNELASRKELYESQRKATDPDIPATAKEAATKVVLHGFSDSGLGLL